MKRALLLLTLAMVALTGVAVSQNNKIRVFLTGTEQSLGNNSNVSAAQVGSSLDKHCPDVVLTIEQDKADYLLQARYTGLSALTKPYKFTLFAHDGDRVFSTETALKDSAVKDVCSFIGKHS